MGRYTRRRHRKPAKTMLPFVGARRFGLRATLRKRALRLLRSQARADLYPVSLRLVGGVLLKRAAL